MTKIILIQPCVWSSL